MRDRLVAAFVGLTFAVIALYGVPRAFYAVHWVEQSRQQEVEHVAAYTAATVAAELAGGRPVTDAALGRTLQRGWRVEYVAADGTTRVVPAGSRVGEGDLVATRPVPAGGGEVRVSLSGAVVQRAVSDVLRPLIVLGVLLLCGAGLSGLLLARRLSRPFTELADRARDLGDGRLPATVPHYEIPEAEAIGGALVDSAHRIDTLIRRERDVAVHASHQLRTPITALRLTLEDLALWPQTHPEVAEELHRIVAEVDRFSDAVTALLEETRSGRMLEAERFDLCATVESSARRWASVAAGVGLRLRVEPCRGAEVELPRGPVSQAVDLLLQHACEVASGTIRVSCHDRGSHLALEVAFAQRHADWHGAPAALARREAAEVAASLGGHLTQEPPQDRAFDEVLVLLLPSAQGVRTLH